MTSTVRQVSQILAATAVLVAVADRPAVAADFYQGKTINFVIGSAAGGTYDFYARHIARHLPRHIPGEPRIVVNNMPGAGGMVSANHVATQAPKDGTVMGMFNRGAVLSAILGSKDAKFDASKYQWLGTTASFADNAHLCVVTGTMPHTSLDDLKNKSLPTVNVGVSGSHHTELMAATFGYNLHLVRGYDRAGLDLAFERGEVDATPLAYTSILSRQPTWLEKGIVRPLIQFARIERHSAFPDVPTAREAAPTPEAKAMLALAEAAFLIAYPFAIAQEVPADRAAILKKAFADMLLNDPAYKEDVTKQNLEHSPKAAADVQAIIVDLAKTPPDVMNRYKEIMTAAGLTE